MKYALKVRADTESEGNELTNLKPKAMIVALHRLCIICIRLLLVRFKTKKWVKAYCI